MPAPTDHQDRRIVAALGLHRLRHLAVMLGMVSTKPRARVLELDTDPDFGYSAFLLARASRGGTVLSVHELTRVSQRAREALSLWTGRAQVSFHTGPLRDGCSDQAPYDLIVSTTLFGWLPQPWLQQCAPAGSIVTPLEHEDPRPRLFLRVGVDEQHRPTTPLVLVETDPHPHHTSYHPAPAVDLHPDDDGYSITTHLTADQYA